MVTAGRVEWAAERDAEVAQRLQEWQNALLPLLRQVAQARYLAAVSRQQAERAA